MHQVHFDTLDPACGFCNPTPLISNLYGTRPAAKTQEVPAILRSSLSCFYNGLIPIPTLDDLL
jgi:hypothetical protein